MNILEIISKKRDSKELSKEEIKSILTEHGKVVNNETEKVKTKLNSEIDTYKTTISNLEKQLEEVPDSKELDNLKKEIADMKTAEKTRIANEKARQEQLEAILNVDKDELLEIAKEIDETLEKGGICIIGGKNQIDQCDLDEVISL